MLVNVHYYEQGNVGQILHLPGSGLANISTGATVYHSLDIDHTSSSDCYLIPWELRNQDPRSDRGRGRKIPDLFEWYVSWNVREDIQKSEEGFAHDEIKIGLGEGLSTVHGIYLS